MTSWTQQGLTLGYYISFEDITSDNTEGTVCNLLKERDSILEVQSSYVLKRLRGLTIKQEDKRLYHGVRG